MKLLLIALFVTAGLSAQTIIASVDASQDFGYVPYVADSAIPGVLLIQRGDSVVVRNEGFKPILSYTVRQSLDSGAINDYAVVNVSSEPVLNAGEEKALNLSMTAPSSVELDAVVFSGGEEAGRDNARTLDIFRNSRNGTRLRLRPSYPGPVPVPDPPFGYVIYYSCQPITCEQDAISVGTFSVGVSVTGQLANFNRSRRKNIRLNPFAEALNCTTPTELLAFGATVDDPTYGYGIAGTVEAFQFGIQVLSLQNIIWYSRSLQLGNPTSPCT